MFTVWMVHVSSAASQLLSVKELAIIAEELLVVLRYSRPCEILLQVCCLTESPVYRLNRAYSSRQLKASRQEAQLSQRGCATLCVIGKFPESLKVIGIIPQSLILYHFQDKQDIDFWLIMVLLRIYLFFVNYYSWMLSNDAI